MDLRIEEDEIYEIEENIKGDEGLRVKKVEWERKGRDVMKIEWIEGIKM